MTQEAKDEPHVVSHSLAPWRTRVAVADIAYTKSGDLLVITSDGQLAR